MKSAGIKIPEYKEFSDFNSGLEFVRSSNKRLVFKPSGTMPCKLTYCSKDNKELEVYMKFVEEKFGKNIDSFVLQEFIEGAVVSSEFICNGKNFLWPPNHTVEEKKANNDNLGPSTGCSGNIVWTCEEGSKIIDQGIALMEKQCVKESYVGNMDLNAVVNESGVYGLEWTPRFGYDATPTLLTLLKQDFGEFFSEIAKGNDFEPEFETKDAGGLRVTIPPYPAEPQGKNSELLSPNIGIPILGYEDFEDQMYFYEIMMHEDRGLCHSGGTGVISCIMGLGDTPESSLEESYKIAEKLVIPDKQYRTDLKKVLSKNIEEVLQYV